jgi:hypothetical protein
MMRRTEFSANLCDVLPENARVRASKVDILENTLGGAELLWELERRKGPCLDSAAVNDDHLAWLYIAHVLGLAQVKGTSFRSHTVSIAAANATPLETPDAQRTETVGVANRAHELFGYDNDGKGSLRLRHGVEDLVDLRLTLRVRDQVQKQFRVHRRLCQDALVFKEGPQLGRV